MKYSLISVRVVTSVLWSHKMTKTVRSKTWTKSPFNQPRAVPRLSSATLLCLEMFQSFRLMVTSSWKKSHLRSLRVCILWLLALMDVVSRHCSEFWVNYGQLLQEPCTNLHSKTFSTFHRDLTCRLEPWETKLFIPICQKIKKLKALRSKCFKIFWKM